MKRVSVIGCPGAGKTTFSRELARITRLPLTHLDRIYHDQSYAYLTDTESWRARVSREIKKKHWIIDGNYKSTLDIRLPASDTVIFLDYPTHLCIRRAIKRRMEFHSAARPDMPPTWKEKLDWQFFAFILKFNRRVAPNIRQLLESYEGKTIVILKSPRQATNYLASLRTGEPWTT